MIACRLVKLVMVASVALFAFVVTFDNIVDYPANFDFVRHVLSMDTTFPGNVLLPGRAITVPWAWTAAYQIIIAVEGLTCVAFTVAAAALARALRAGAADFARAKRFVFIGAGIGFLLWFTGFMVVGGEYFTMWQSRIWNGQEGAFRFYLTLLAVLIFVNQPDAELRR